MKPFKDYDKTQAYTESRKIPTGYYIGKILNAEEKQNMNSDGSRLEISVDVTEGEYKDYYRDNYKSQSFEFKKWKGVLVLFVPNDDGSEKDSWTKRAFKTATTAIEESNDGYHWDWDEKALKGLTVGFAVRQEEWSPGKWAPKVFRFVSVENVYSGKLKAPEDKPLKQSTSADGDFTPASDDDLPF